MVGDFIKISSFQLLPKVGPGIDCVGDAQCSGSLTCGNVYGHPGSGFCSDGLANRKLRGQRQASE